jgi:hypothetical protein
MARKDLPCNRCGKLMWRTKEMLPEGQARCQPCRRIEPQRTGCHTGPRWVMCPECWQMFDRGRQARRKFCSSACAMRFIGEQQRVRAPDDQHQQRCERAKSAPGLTGSQRSKLLQRWKRQSRLCAYCDAPATTVDHVVALVRGGTNYEGNLVPCCRPCNGRKAGWLVIEWRTGRRLERMARPLAWAKRIRAAAKVKPPKPEPVPHPCPLCSVPTIRKVCCSKDCSIERNNRQVRDKYRASVGLPVDPDQPTKRWRSRDAAEVFIVRPDVRGEATQLAFLW